MLIRRLRYWLDGAKREAALRDEMELHIEETAGELRDRGLSESDALAEARRRFGNITLKREESREIWIARWWSEIVQDLRYGARALFSQPIFMLAAVLSLVLGIAVNAVLFNVYNALAFAPWAIRDPASAAQIWTERRPGEWGGMPWLQFQHVRERVQSLEGLAAFSGNEFRVHAGNQAWDLETVTASGNYFDVLGSGFALGRGFSTTVDSPHDPAAEAVLHHDTWRTKFASDPDIIGRPIEIGGHGLVVVGVAAKGFDGAAANKPALWIPFGWHDVLRPGQHLMTNADNCCVSVMARLGSGTTRATAQAELGTLSTQRVFLTAPSFLANPRHASQFAVVFIPVGVAFLLILLLACANVANLQMVRGTARRREITVRLALGASRTRVLRQFLIESLLLSAIAGTISLIVSAIVPFRLFSAIAGSQATLTFRFENDIRVYIFVLIATLAAAILSGLIPAIHALRGVNLKVLGEGARATASGRMRSILLGAQMALCAMLLCGTMLLVRALDHVHQMDVGFDTSNLIVMSTGLETSGANDKEAAALLAQLTPTLPGLPGVESMALTNMIPLGENFSETGVEDPRTRERIEVGIGRVSADFFTTLGIPLVAGRSFREGETAETNIVIVNEAMAHQLWPGENAVGKTVKPGRTLEVIGVVRNFATQGFGSQQFPYMWTAGNGNRATSIIIRHSGAAQPLLRELTRRAHELDRRFLATAVPYSETIAEAGRMSRISAGTASVLGVLCLLVACIGIHGVTAYNVSLRKREVGIRMALGAQSREILTMVLRQNLRTVVAGVALGIVGALGFGHLLTSLLYGLEPTDPPAFLITIAILLGTSVFAAWGPARRCSRVNPSVTLRHE
jgi:predicted permease